MVGYRTVKVREDVYQRLARLADSSGKSMSDLIEELLDNYESGVRYSDVVVKLGRIEAILRECLGKLSTRV
jgi:predicted CopG family antitoxin